jgi:hypothetical protein
MRTVAHLFTTEALVLGRESANCVLTPPWCSGTVVFFAGLSPATPSTAPIPVPLDGINECRQVADRQS